MAERVGDSLVGRVAAESVLRDQCVEEDDGSEGERERIRKQRPERESALSRGVERDACERNEQQDILPRLNRGEGVAVDTGA
jgi:hypothetical protein